VNRNTDVLQTGCGRDVQLVKMGETRRGD